MRSNTSQKTLSAGGSLKINTSFSGSEKYGAHPNTFASQKTGLNTFTDNTAATSAFSYFLNEKSTDTATSELDLGSYMSTGTDHRIATEDSAGLDNYADLFGQPTPISLRERIERGYLRKHSSSKAKSTGKLRKVVNQFVSSFFCLIFC